MADSAETKTLDITAPVEDRNQIVHLLLMLDEKTDIAESRLEGYQDLFKTMLHELMTGSIRTTGLA